MGFYEYAFELGAFLTQAAPCSGHQHRMLIGRAIQRIFGTFSYKNSGFAYADRIYELKVFLLARHRARADGSRDGAVRGHALRRGPVPVPGGR